MSFLENIFCGQLQQKNKKQKQKISSLKDKNSEKKKKIHKLQKRVNSEKKKKIHKLQKRVNSLQKDPWPDLETRVVDKSEVKSALQEFDEWNQRQAYWWDDYKYRVPTQDSFMEVIGRDATDQKEYHKEFFDCDNFSDVITALFAERYQCNAVGTVISPEAKPPHAFNVVILDKGDHVEAALFEPQTDSFVTTNNKRYTLNGALIRI